MLVMIQIAVNLAIGMMTLGIADALHIRAFSVAWCFMWPVLTIVLVVVDALILLVWKK